MIPPMELRFWQEVGWTIAVAAGLAIATALVTFDPESITDWRVWGLGLLANAIRAAATAVIASLTRPEPADL